jgi:acyl dehydratase
MAEIEARSARGEVVTTLVAGLTWGGPAMSPDLEAYPAAPLPVEPPTATATALAGLDPLGTPVLHLDATVPTQAAEDLEDPLPDYRGPRAIAHPGLLLRQANRALAENVALGAWIHVSSDVTHLGFARAGDRLETRGRVARVYERGGRGWVDLDLLLVVPDADRPIARIRHTAIYRLDGPAPAG